MKKSLLVTTVVAGIFFASCSDITTSQAGESAKWAVTDDAESSRSIRSKLKKIAIKAAKVTQKIIEIVTKTPSPNPNPDPTSEKL
ncbi:MAG: hypothetical protein IJ558_06660 [Treponema sp.]|nr:hypothetical protein [Treponema sp.]